MVLDHQKVEESGGLPRVWGTGKYRGQRRRRRWLLLALLFVGIAGAGAFFVPIRADEPGGGPEARELYPELSQAATEAVHAIEQAWPTRSLSVCWLADSGRDGKRKPPPFAAVEKALDAAGPDAALALLRVMFDTAPTTPWQSFHASTRDADFRSPAHWLASHQDGSLDPLLLRMVTDRELHPSFRLDAVIALARPGNVKARDTLTVIVRDRVYEREYRREILFRLPRLRLPLLESLRELLYVPFHDTDIRTAVILAIAGQPEAPGLVVEAMSHFEPVNKEFNEFNAAELPVEAARRLTRDDPSILSLIASLDVVRYAGVHPPEYAGPLELRKSGVNPIYPTPTGPAIARAVEAWLARHPEALETAFEKEHRAYLESPRRRRELALGTFQDILATDEKDIDLAAAALVLEANALGHDASWRERVLERLQRLSALVRCELDGTQDAERAIAILNRRLQPAQTVNLKSWEGLNPSGLCTVLHQQWGSCLGMTLLYLSVAERVGLPLHAVAVPGHCFVRWDDGKTRRNIETIEQGIEKSDATYMKEFAVAREDIEAGRHLVNLPKKQILSGLCRNFSMSWAHSPRLEEGTWRYEKSLECAGRAVDLDPRSPEAYLARVDAALSAGPGREAETRQDVKRARELAPRSPVVRRTIADLLRKMGRAEEALAEYDQVLKRNPGDSQAMISRFNLLLELGRSEQAKAALETFLKHCPESPEGRTLRLQALVRLRDPRWRTALKTLTEESGDYVEPCLLAAHWLLRPEDDHGMSPESALALLDDLRFLESGPRPVVVQSSQGGVIALGSEQALQRLHHLQDYFRLRAEALDALGRLDEAEAARSSLERLLRGNARPGSQGRDDG